MKHRFLQYQLTLLLWCFTGIFSLLWIGDVAAQSAPDQVPPSISTEQPNPASLLLGVQPGTDITALSADLQAQGYAIIYYSSDLGILHVVLDGDGSETDAAAASMQRQQAEVTAAALTQDARLTYVEMDGLVTIAQEPPPALEPEPNDALAASQYALARVRAREAWDITHGDPAVTIAVIDTGYVSTHEDFSPDNLWRNQAEYAGLPNIDDDANGFIDDIVGWDWWDNDNDPEDGNGHGTHIMGSIVALTNNNRGVSGLGRDLRVSPLRIFGPSGTGSISNLVAAIDYAIQQDMPIINLSLTTSTDSPSLRAAVEHAAARDILVIAASGNMPAGSSLTAVQYPAVYPTTLAVAATDADDNWAPFSRFGPTVDLAAPGASILSTHLADQYRSISGTSMATAHVSALAGLLRSLRPDLSAPEIVQIMLDTAEDVNGDTHPGDDIYLGAGRIDMAAALLQASTALTITADAYSILPTQDPETGELRIRVSAPPGPQNATMRLPVHNAVVHYRALTDPVGEWQRTFTNSQGEALIPVASTESITRVELQIGAVNRIIEATLLPAGTQLQLTTAATTTLASESPISYTVRLLDETGTPITATVPVHLRASLGEFETGETSFVAELANGTYTGQFYPGTLATSGVLTATLGSWQDTQSLTVLPARPATILGPEKLFSEVSVSSNTILLNFRVLDAYDNPVVDGTQLTLFSSAGTLAATTLLTQDGEAATTIRLPSFQSGTVTVWVVAHAGPVEIRVDIPAVRVRAFLPNLMHSR